jgi:transcriptional regulator NrdR family protein
MQCPRCGQDGRSKVYESRQAGGCVWRRRCCLACYKVYVTCEQSGPDLRMPEETQSRKRSAAARRLMKPSHEGMPATSDGGAALTAVWARAPA